MNQSIDIPQVEARRSLLVAGREWSTLLTLIRRELWEHRVLWMAPLAVAVLMLVSAAFGRVHIAGIVGEGRMVLTPRMVRAIFAVAVLWVGLVEYATMLLVLWYYAADCLYAERRDRSILFWKSMPVSDGETVLSKVLVALVVVPIGVYLMAAVTTVLTSGIWSIRGWSGYSGPLFWDTSTWLQLEGVTFVGLVVASLWYSPVVGYLMLVSTLARRNVQLWVFLPPIVAMLVERFAFGTHYLFTIVMYRLLRIWPSGVLIYVRRLFTGENPGADATSLSPSPSPFHLIDPAQAFGNIDLWIGVAVAVALLFAATRIRRYRDET